MICATFNTGTSNDAWSNNSNKIIIPSELIGRYIQRWRVKATSLGVTGPRPIVLHFNELATQAYSVDLRFNGGNGLPGQITSGDVIVMPANTGGFPPIPSIWFAGQQEPMRAAYGVNLCIDIVAGTFGATSQPSYISNTTNAILMIEIEFVTTRKILKQSAYKGNALSRFDGDKDNSDSEED